MAKKPARTITNQMSQQKKSAILLTAGIILLVIISVLGTLGVVSYFEKGQQTLHRQVSITTTDGLMGLIGQEIALKPGDMTLYTVNYTNDSSKDLMITIKATQREHDYSKKWCKGVACDPGAWTGSTYSEKKLVKSGESTKFLVPVTPTGEVSTGSVELEAFKTIQD